MAKRPPRICSRCRKPAEWYNHTLCLICSGIEAGTRCAACTHDRTFGHGYKGGHPCSAEGCGCPEFVREEAA